MPLNCVSRPLVFREGLLTTASRPPTTTNMSLSGIVATYLN